MLNPKLKKFLYSFPLVRSIRDWLVTCYRRHLFNARCRLLRHVGPSILTDVHRTLSSAGISYFADYGTLLGIVRDRGFIKHDDDIDYSIPVGSVSPEKLIRVLDAIEGMTLAHAFVANEKISELSYHLRGIQVDFFFIEFQNDKMYGVDYLEPSGNYSLFKDPWRKRIQERCKPEGIHEIHLNNFVTAIPSNAEQVLEMIYGDWRTPIKGWKGQIDSGQMPYEMTGEVGVMLKGEQVREFLGLTRGDAHGK